MSRQDFRAGFVDGVERGPTVLEWQGDAHPEWLRARLVKNGPGRFGVGTDRYHHWFDGLALLLEFDFADEVSYRAAYLKSPDYVDAMRAGRVVYTEFATVPKRSFWRRLWCTLSPIAQFGDNASINFLTTSAGAVAISDLPGGIVLDPDTLEVTGTMSLHRPPILLTNTPHPQHDDARGEWFNVGIGLSWRGFGYEVFALPDDSSRPRSVAFVRRRAPAYMHTVGATERYVVIIEHPMKASLARFFTLALRKAPIIDAFRWDGTRPLRFVVVDKDSGEVVTTVEAPAAFAFHATNLYDDGDDVVIDLCTYPDDRPIDELYLDRLLGPDGGDTTPATLQRYRIHTSSSRLTGPERITEASVEFPTAHPGHLHRAYTYTYAASKDPGRPGDFTNALVKVNVQTGEVLRWAEPGCYPTEPVMVPDPQGTAEDDGVVLCVVLDATRETSMLLMLDAASFTERGRAYLPDVVPFGLHGVMLPRRSNGDASNGASTGSTAPQP